MEIYLGGFFLMEPVLATMPITLLANARIWITQGQATLGFWTEGTTPSIQYGINLGISKV